MSTIHINSSSRSAIVSSCSEVFFDDIFLKKAICKNNANGYIQNTSDGFPPCSFTGKEKDEETGYGYFGARYLDHELMTMWLSVDPMADKYPYISSYAYCAWNPVKLVDPDGRMIDDYFSLNGEYLGSDDAETKNVRIIKECDWNSLKEDGNGIVKHDLANQMSTSFSEASANGMSEKAQLSVYQHYNPTEYKLQNLENDGETYGMRSHFEHNKEPVIQIRLKGNSIGLKICDYADEIKNIFSHEKAHVDHYKKVGHLNYQSTSRDIREQIAVSAQMKDASWSGTREKYKQEFILYGEKHGLKIQ